MELAVLQGDDVAGMSHVFVVTITSTVPRSTQISSVSFSCMW